jgi:hypothetical protein
MKSTCSIGVVTLKAIVHRFHSDPNNHIVRTVSAVVPRRVVMQERRKIVRRK